MSEDPKYLCIICQNQPFLPTCINIYKNGDFIRQCPASIKSPLCLTCIRHYNEYSRDFVYRCPWRCCEGNKIKPTYLMYGFPKRAPADYAELMLWSVMDTYGIFNLKCNKCEHVCATMEEARDHPRLVCPKRKISCKMCHVAYCVGDGHECIYDGSIF